MNKSVSTSFSQYATTQSLSEKALFSESQFSIVYPQDKSYKNSISKPKFIKKSTYEPLWLALEEQEQATTQTDLISHWILTNRKLIYQRGKRRKLFWLSQIAHLELKFKRLMFPLLFGGIGGTFCLLASLKGVLNWWVGLSLGAVGLLLFYYGMKGRYQLEVYLKNHTLHTFFIEDTDRNWDSFYKQLKRVISFTNN